MGAQDSPTLGSQIGRPIDGTLHLFTRQLDAFRVATRESTQASAQTYLICQPNEAPSLACPKKLEEEGDLGLLHKADQQSRGNCSILSRDPSFYRNLRKPRETAGF